METPLRILLVDDDPHDRQFVLRTVQQAFPLLEVAEAAAEAALEHALQGVPPDVVLTDYALGWSSGLVVLLRVKARWPEVPVLMVTGTGSEEIAVECMREGLEDYILKSPRHILRLPAAIQAALDRVQERRALREAETRYQSLFAGVSIGLYRATAAGQVLEANPALVRLLGYPSRDALRGTSVYDWCVDAEASAQWRAWLAGGPDTRTDEVRIRRRDGAIRWVEHQSRAVREPSGQCVHFDGSVEDVTARKDAEAALRRQHEELRRLASRLAEVEEAERQRLARELHDQVGQNLTALSIGLTVLQSRLPRRVNPHVGARLADLLRLVEETTARIRTVMGDLRPPVLDDYGLVAALGWYANQWTDRTQVPVEVAGEECDPRLPLVTENALFRIAQEALNNIAKHAGASHVTIAVAADPSGVHLTIADDGQGFSAAAPTPPDNRCHWGLRIMQERAVGVGGVCRCESRLGEGTRIRVQVPR